MSHFFFHNISVFLKRSLALAVTFSVIAFATSCKSAKEIVEIPVYITDTINKTEYKTDSIYIDRYTKEYVKGDTVFLEKIEYKYVENKVYDTLVEYRETPIEVEKIVEVEKKLNKFQKFLMVMGTASIICFVIYICKRLFGKSK